jgi:tartrate dehydrogenase/decarboxylase/D-malate dehydrogenase
MPILLSDLAAALAGSLGIRADRQHRPERRYRACSSDSWLGLRHHVGSGESGRYVLGCVMLLEHLGECRLIQLMQAIQFITADKKLHTGDLGGQATMRKLPMPFAGCAHNGW